MFQEQEGCRTSKPGPDASGTSSSTSDMLSTMPARQPAEGPAPDSCGSRPRLYLASIDAAASVSPLLSSSAMDLQRAIL